MSIEKISDAARDAASVGALADRPQATERDGYSGMTPTQLKAAFDALPKLNTAKINEIIDLINGESTESLAYLLQTPVEYQEDTMTLYEFLAAVQDGRFGDIAMIGSRTLSAAIDHAAGEVFETKMAGVTAEATTLTPGSPATASYNNSTKKFTFGIPKGDPGSGGGGGDGEVKVLVATEEEISIGFSAEDADYLFNHDNYDPAHSAGFIKPTVIYVPSYIFNSNEYALAFIVTSASYATNGNLTLGAEAVLYDGTTRFFHMALYGQRLSGNAVSGGITEITLLEKGDITTVIDTMHTLMDNYVPSAKAVKTKLADKENVGKIKISGTEYTVTRKALTITENGVTTTYYVADIT